MIPKFRAFHKAERKMYRVVALYLGRYEASLTIAESCQTLPMTEVELMQATGLLDKNDKEIYEGDIVDYLENTSQGLVKKTVVIDDIRHLPDFSCSKWQEVIGNRYEDPKLLPNQEVQP